MNKTKKITAVAVSLVMAGTMVATLAACTPKGGSGDGKPALDSEGNLTYSDNIKLNTAIGYSGLDTSILYTSDTLNNETKGTGMYKYLNTTGSSSFNLFGKSYGKGSLKPAWQALSEQLKININDSWTGKGSDSQMSEVIGSELKLSGYNIITASASSISDEGLKGNLLNITDYLEYMPNYSAFLKQYPNARLSLTADENGAMYMLPYFDGNDDIEKYVLLRKDIVASLLDSDLSGVTSQGVTFKAQGEAKNADENTASFNVVTTDYSVESFMGKTGADKYTVKVTNPAHLTGSEYKGYKTEIDNAYADGTKDGALIDVTVDYGAALTAALDDSTPLGAAIKEAAGTKYTGASGNIVDLQNFAIHEKQGAVYGKDLLNILREYIKVAYTSGGSSFYTQYKLSDVFNSAYAAWDVDLYVALGRCYTTCGDIINALATIPGSTVANATKYLYLLSGRRNTSQRINDVVSLVGELYGVRGLESRYPYAYIDETGNLKDARNKTVTYEALDKMSKLVKEGLLVGGSGKDALGSEDRGLSSTNKSGKTKTNVQTLSLHEYVQTQTAYNIGADALDPDSSGPVLTPVSKWTVNGTVKHMRFTESWRGVKNTGWCITKATANNPKKLSACLALVDYFFSNDGQILMTYGPQSTKGDTAVGDYSAGGGFWYATEASDITWDEAVAQGIVKTNDGGKQYYVDPDKKDAGDVLYTSKYFAYGNKLYTGTLYGKRMIPTMTSLSLDMFKSDKLGNKSFTNYARYYLGTALNIGNKDQGFEYQCTAESGIMGSKIVNIALGNGTIEHVEQHLPTLAGTGVTLTDAQKYDNWKTMTIPVLPYDPAYSTALNNTPYTWITGFNLSETSNNCIFFATSKKRTNIMIDIMTYGLGGGNINYAEVAIPSTAQGVVTYIEGIGNGNGSSISNIMTRIEGYMQEAWLTAVKANTNTES